MNISELLVKVKELRDRVNTRETYTILLIIVVGFGSFGLGRLSRLQEGKSGIKIEQASAAAFSSPPFQGGDRGVVASPLIPLSKGGRLGGLSKGVPPSSGVGVVTSPASGGLPAEALAKAGQLVASKTGSKYHFPWCSGAQRISEANKVWFDSVESARKAGYTPASNCKGLK